MQPILFKNYTDQDFVGIWDKMEYKIKAGKTIYLEAHLACHFAKHLTDREMLKKGLGFTDPTKNELVKLIHPALVFNPKKHQVLINEDLLEEDDDDEPTEDVKTKVINKNKKKSKPKAKKKKEEPKEEEKVEGEANEVQPPEVKEEAFEDLEK